MNFENYKTLFELNQQDENLPNWFREKQNLAFEIFYKKGFPTTKDEEWRFTNISPIEEMIFKNLNDNINDYKKAEKYLNDKWNSVPIVNGVFVKELSKVEDGIKIANLSDENDEIKNQLKNYFSQSYISFKDSIVNLNTSLLNDVLVIKIKKDVKINSPIHILNFQTKNIESAILNTRIIVYLEENSDVTIFEEFISESENVYWNNSVVEYFISKNANLNHIKLQNENKNSFHISNNGFYQSSKSNLNSVNISLGSKISRSESKVFLCEPEINSSLNGLYISSDKQLIDNHTFIEHKKENCKSNELYKGILFDESRSVFNGKIYVHSEAQKTDSKQTNKNLLLSDLATIDTKPQLEIFADDVKCTHGGTVGGLEEIPLFYLESRGVNKDVAKGILTIGFASEVTELILNREIRQKADDLIIKKLRETIKNENLPEIIHTN